MNDKVRKSAAGDATVADRAELLKRALREIETLDAKLAAAEKVRNEPVAIIGMACRFAAGANDPERYWQLLVDGIDGVSEVPPERWSVEDYYDPDPDAVGKAYTVMGGFMDDVDHFDANFFGISPREAEQMDPQQRWLLQITWEALENAGLAPERMIGSPTGVFVGMTGSDFLFLQTGNDTGNIDTYVASGNSHAVAAGRLSYVMGFRGPAMTIDTACSSALLAVHLACQSLRLGECDTALAGGVLLLLAPGAYVTACKARLLSPDGHCKTFDDSADGYVRAEGCAMVTLKRLSDAERDGDNVLAIIRGSACNQDGRSGGLTVPSGNAQEAVIRKALANAGIEPRDVSFVESHGTGTSLGDPIEVQALDHVYSEQRRADRPLVIGSVKSNIGHTEALAGVAGLIKLVLSLQREKIPGNLHFNTPNSHIPWQDLSIRVADRLLDWPQWADRKIGGLSSFGFSGTNVHMIVEQAKPRDHSVPATDRPVHLMAISARREAAVQELASRYLARLDKAPEDESVADFCHTANAGRSHFEYRAIIKAATMSELRAGLEDLAHGRRRTAVGGGKVQTHGSYNVGFVFSGDGGAYVNMGRSLYESQPTFRAVMSNCERLLQDRLEKPLLSVLYPEKAGDGRQILDDPRYAQPAVVALGWALVEMWESFGVTPTVVAGHGSGEIAAACAAGIMDFEAGLLLAAERGRLLGEYDGTGAMAAINAGESEVRGLIAGIDGVDIAAINGLRSVVISGDMQAVSTATARLAEHGFESEMLGPTIPLHTGGMTKAAGRVVVAAQKIEHGAAHIDFVSMSSGRVASGRDAPTPEYWGDQLRRELRVLDALRTVRNHGCNALIEIGPNATLLGMARRALPESRVQWLPSLRADGDEWDQTLAVLTALYLGGMDIDWSGFDKGYPRRKIALPTYPFAPQSYPIRELAPRTRPREVDADLHPLLGRRLRSPRLQDQIWEVRLDPEQDEFGTWRYFDSAFVSPAELLEAMVVAGREIDRRHARAVTGFERHGLLAPEGRTIVQVIAGVPGDTGSVVEIVSSTETATEPSQDWICSARATLRSLPDEDRPQAPADVRAEWEQRCKEQWRGAQLYETLSDNGIAVVPECRLIESLQRRDGEVLARLHVEHDAKGRRQAMPIPFGLVEACSQLALTASPGMPALRPGSAPSLLHTVESLWLAEQMPDDIWVHAESRVDAGGAVDGCDLRLFDPDGCCVGEMIGMSHAVLAAGVLPAADGRRLDRWLYTVDWQRENQPAVEPEPDRQQQWLLLADRGGRATALRDALISRGEQARLAEHDEPLAGVTEGADLSIVYLRALDMEDPANDDSDPARATADACDEFLTFARAIVQADLPVRVSLTTVTRGAQSVPLGEGKPALAQTAFVGLHRVLASEHPELSARIIDLDPNAGSAADELAAELVGGSAAEDRQLALRGGDRYVPRLVRVEAAEEDRRAPDFGAGAFLITGGLGGVGLSIANWLAHQGAKHLFLMGRSGASKDAKERIAALESLGAKVEVIKADVGVTAELQAALARIDSTGVPLRGVFHAAGVLDDAMLAHQDRKRLEKVLRPKVNGTWALHTLTADRELEFFVMFSAAAALFGNPGQSNYAAANLFLDGMAHYRRSLGLPALSINWGAWAQVGMAAALGSQTHDRWAQLGVGQIDPWDGAQAMGRAMLHDIPQLAVMPINWTQWRRAFPGSSPPPFTSRLLEGSGTVADAGPSVAELLAQMSSADSERTIHLGEYVTRQLAVLLGLAAESIDKDLAVSDLGFDSLMATTLKTQIMSDLGIDIPVAAILDGPSTNEIAARVLAVFDTVRADAGSNKATGPMANAAEDAADWEEGTL